MPKSFQRIRSILDYPLKEIISYSIFRVRLIIASKPIKPNHRSAMIFAPHQDDESFGCGGIIALKRASGVPVRVVYITGGQNGQKTPEGRIPIPARSLTAIRNKEALQALGILGVPRHHVTFLNYMDGGLRSLNAVLQQEIVMKLVELLSEFQPEEVYVTYRNDGHPDHNSAYLLVQAAIREAGLNVDLLEYPVWSIFNPRLKFRESEFKNFYRLPIEPVRKRKIQAIRCYRSQYVPIGGLSHTFLKRLSSRREFFFKS